MTRRVNRVLWFLVVLLTACIALAALTRPANAATLGATPAAGSGAWALLTATPAKILYLASIAIPYLTAFLTAHPSHLTGILTGVVAGLGGVFTQLAVTDDVTWSAVLLAIVSWAVAGGWHARASKNFELKVLHPKGLKLGVTSPGEIPPVDVALPRAA